MMNDMPWEIIDIFIDFRAAVKLGEGMRRSDVLVARKDGNITPHTGPE